MRRSAFALALVAAVGLGSAVAAGPFDGQWTGGSPTGGTTAQGRPCPATAATVNIVDGKIFGSYADAQDTFAIRGTIAPDGTASGQWGEASFTGKFAGNRFAGKSGPKSCNTERSISLDKAG